MMACIGTVRLFSGEPTSKVVETEQHATDGTCGGYACLRLVPQPPSPPSSELHCYPNIISGKRMNVNSHNCAVCNVCSADTEYMHHTCHFFDATTHVLRFQPELASNAYIHTVYACDFQRST